MKTPECSILETALYVAALDLSERFYTDLLGAKTILSDDRMRALRLNERQVLLLFARGKSTDGAEVPGGHIPGHDGQGRLHLAFAIEEAAIELWRKKLIATGIEIISEVTPPQGGKSLYFRDPDGHLIEMATPIIWPA